MSRKPRKNGKLSLNNYSFESFDAYLTPIIVPIILKAFVRRIPNILDQVDPII